MSATVHDSRATTVGEAVRELRGLFAAAGIDSPALDARLLVCAATGIGHERLLLDPDRPVTVAERGALDAMVARRLGREPVSRIVGEREFWGRSFAVSPATLDPRPDSETVVEAVVEWAARRSTPVKTVVDLGTGTGCLLISILGELDAAFGIGVDIDPTALGTAAVNAERYLDPGRLGFVCGDWLAPIIGPIDVIVANPPYIVSEEIDGLSPEVALFEPRRALDGGLDGLDAYRQIAAGLSSRIARGGLVAVEVGVGQAESVAQVLEQAGLTVLNSRPDLAGRTRCICATLVV